jgi:XTP/dITP diphosphohydrolase
MTALRTLLIATANPGKLREILAILGDLTMAIKGLQNFQGLPEPVEDARTFMGNAEIKAAHYARLSGLTTLADDSGLEVDRLGGEPGVRSARFAGVHGDDRANNTKLIDLLRGVPQVERTARFRCAIVVADGRSVLARAEGSLEGLIIDPPRGRNGFGYDPHFLVSAVDKTTAELDPEHKNRISHRGLALRSIRKSLGELQGG